MYIDLSRYWKKDWYVVMLNERFKLIVEIMVFLFCYVVLCYMYSKWSSILGFVIVEYSIFICLIMLY